MRKFIVNDMDLSLKIDICFYMLKILNKFSVLIIILFYKLRVNRISIFFLYLFHRNRMILFYSEIEELLFYLQF